MTNSKDYKIEAMNDQIKCNLVSREVYTCCTDIVEYILEAANYVDNAPFTSDDIENLFRKYCTECGESPEEIFESDIVPYKRFRCSCCGVVHETYHEAFECCSVIEDDEVYTPEEVWICPFCEGVYATIKEAQACICHYQDTIYRCPYCGKYDTESDVSEQPQEVYEWWEVSDWFGEKLQAHGEVVIRGYHTYWGRCTTGQAIYADGIIHRIADDMQILCGQEHSWEYKTHEI